jgi:hypothetical protein
MPSQTLEDGTSGRGCERGMEGGVCRHPRTTTPVRLQVRTKELGDERSTLGGALHEEQVARVG